MKIFFVEGPDNIGKSTYVKAIQQFLYGKYCTNVLVMHCEKPVGETLDEQIEFQNNAYEKLVDQLIEWNNNNEYDAVIFDRAWYGEYVYGTMYRNRDKEDVKINEVSGLDNVWTILNRNYKNNGHKRT